MPSSRRVCLHFAPKHLGCRREGEKNLQQEKESPEYELLRNVRGAKLEYSVETGASLSDWMPPSRRHANAMTTITCEEDTRWRTMVFI